MNSDELYRELAEARVMIDALRKRQVDGVGDQGFSLVRLHETDRALHSTETLLRQLIDGNIIGIVVAEPDRILQANKTYLDIIGHTAADLLDGGIDWMELTPEEYRHLDNQAIKDLLATGRCGPFEKEYIRKDGSRITVLLGAALISHDPFQWVAFVLDMSAQKEVEAQLQKLNESLEQEVQKRTEEAQRRTIQLRRLANQLTDAEDRERERIADLLHDDLQQHLAGLKYSLATLFRPGSEATESSIRKLGKQIDECVQKTRELSHELSPVALTRRGLLVGFRWLAEHMQQACGLKVNIKGTAELDPSNSQMATVLFRSARELLFNVHKHAGVDEADLVVEATSDTARVTVKDAGRGFDPERIHDTGAHSGLGLFGLEERVVSMGGSVEIRSNPGDGTQVTISVPVGSPPGTLTEGAVQDAPGSRGVTTVLLADDHEVMRRGLSSLLSQQQNLRVVAEVATGRDAIAVTCELKPNVVLMDVSMPEVDGIRATREITRTCPETQVVALSMHDDPETRERMMQAGATAYFSKTDPPESLVRLLLSIR